MCLMKQAWLSEAPSSCHPGTASPGAGGMELAPAREAGRLDRGQAVHLIQTQLELI